MEPISVLFVIVAVITALGLLASVWGADTRPGLDDNDRHPETTGIA